MIYEKAGKQIQLLRKQKGLTQAELAEAIDSSQKYISEVENGHKEPSLKFYMKIANFFEVSLDSIFQYDLVNQNNIYINATVMKMQNMSETEQRHIVEYIDLFSNYRESR